MRQELITEIINNKIMNNRKIEQKFKGKLLGVRNSKKKSNYYIEDFLDKKELVEFIVSTHDHESSFTKNGFDFIEQYYGLDEIIKMVLLDYPEYPFDEGVTPRDALLVKKQYAISIDND